MASGAPVSQASTPKKTPATPRKRKSELEGSGSAKKARASPSKKAVGSTLGSGDDDGGDEEMSLVIKPEPKEEGSDDSDDPWNRCCAY